MKKRIIFKKWGGGGPVTQLKYLQLTSSLPIKKKINELNPDRK